MPNPGRVHIVPIRNRIDRRIESVRSPRSKRNNRASYILPHTLKLRPATGRRQIDRLAIACVLIVRDALAVQQEVGFSVGRNAFQRIRPTVQINVALTRKFKTTAIAQFEHKSGFAMEVHRGCGIALRLIKQ